MPLKHLLHDERQPSYMSVEDAFRDDEIICLICGKGGMKTLARHLNFIHDLKPGGYRKLFGLKGKRPLTARKYGQMRREFVKQKNSIVFLPLARAAKTAKRLGQHTVSDVETTYSVKRAYKRRNVSVEVPSGT